MSLVELADVTSSDAVVPAVAHALGVVEAGFDGTALSLAPVLRQRRILLVLDNLEHVLDCAAHVSALTRSCPELVVLATSRAALRIRPERQVRISPFRHETAIELFRPRMAAAGAPLDEGGHDMAHRGAVDALCVQSDGLPLALELAASAAAAIGPVALLDRLDVLQETGHQRDRPARQHSMDATLRWSLQLLSEPARSLLDRLAVCVGGFSFAVAESLGGAEPTDVLRALAELLDHSLVTRVAEVEGTERFRMLEPVRQGVVARLDGTTREEARSGIT